MAGDKKLIIDEDGSRKSRPRREAAKQPVPSQPNRFSAADPQRRRTGEPSDADDSPCRRHRSRC